MSYAVAIFMLLIEAQAALHKPKQKVLEREKLYGHRRYSPGEVGGECKSPNS